jgi:hypothetical protein
LTNHPQDYAIQYNYCQHGEGYYEQTPKCSDRSRFIPE